MSNVNREEYDIEVELTLLTPEEGGRSLNIRSEDYFKVDLAGKAWNALFHFQDRQYLNPGETARGVLVKFPIPHLIREYLTMETPLLLHEKGQLVGRGRITNFLNLEKNAEESRHREEVRARHAEELRILSIARQACRKREECDLEIDLTLLTPEEGGRDRGICLEYRCTVDLVGSYWVADFYLQDRECLNPGETARVLVWTTVPHMMFQHLTMETPLLLREGGRLTGRGRIIEFLNLEKHAARYLEQGKEARLSRRIGEKNDKQEGKP